ncbi:hypothetical protein [Calidifontibacter terrae]
MTVDQLRDLLADLPGDAEVRLATQPTWPLAFHTGAVVTGDELAGEATCDQHGDYSCEDCEDESIVWITEGGSVHDAPYAPSGVFQIGGRF